MSSYSQTTIDSEDFESGWGIWNDGGADCYLSDNPSPIGTGVALGIQDNSGTSRATTDDIDLTSFSSVDIDFTYHGVSMETGEDFWLRYSDNGGSSWVTIATYIQGTDFSNGINYSPTVTIDTGSYTFSTNSQFRFQCDATRNNDDVYIDDITITGFTPSGPEIDITGLGNSITDGDTTPSTLDDTDFGSENISGGTNANTFTIDNLGTLDLILNGGSTPFVSISGTHASDFTITSTASSPIAASGSTTFEITFDPSAIGLRTATVTINNNDSSPEDVYTFDIEGTGFVPLTEGPGGVTADLGLWLKGNDGLSYTDGQSVSLWADQGHGSNATVNTSGQEPTYKDNVNDNVNFNPVVDFDNDYVTIPLDGDFSYDDTSTQFLEGTSGFYSQDIFTVIIPDVNSDYSFGSMDIFCGDEDIATNNTDATGIGLGKYTVRFTNEVLSYCHGPTSSGDGYGVAQTSTSATYDNAGIINVRNNAGATQQELYYNAIDKETTQNDVPDFANVNDARFWIGRSEGWEASTDARIAEIITYSSRKTDTDLTVERNRIMSYLAIKYGITLGVNGTSQDYVDSDGTVIWDVDTGTPANDVFNYDIAGIGRDDDSELHQKQSRSVNNALDNGLRGRGVLTMGISSIHDTNNLNTSTDLNDKEFLVWGNDGTDLDNVSDVIDVDMSSGITHVVLGTDVIFHGIARIWKVVENVPNPGVDDIPTVEVAILESAVRTATPPNGRYLMFISDTPNFGPTADYKVMTLGTNELGEAILKTNYDFDGTKYITFGWAPERVYTRSVYFNGTGDYINMEDALNLNPTAFTLSAWINRDAADTGIASIVSKRGATFTQGYDFRIRNNNKIQFSVINGSVQSLISNTIIPDNEWHHVAVTYDGTTTSIYIDGVLDITEVSTPPTNTTEFFYIGAAGKNTPTQHFMGNIDEVRVWDTNLTERQIRYIMNQEIEENTSFVHGSYFLDKGITPTKNDIATIPWSNLAGYYPMTTFTFTGTKDESGNGNRGSLKNLTTVDTQTAPLPYRSTADGDWNTNATWENGNMQTIPGTRSIVNGLVTVDWNIVETNHNVTMSNSTLPVTNNDNRNLLALSVESNEVKLSGDNATDTGNALTITHFLSIDGKIDLEGESQLIQTTDSDFDFTSAGTLEKDQQGTQDLYTYNYWSSPVGVSNITTNNNSYTLNNNIFKDGTDSDLPININFVSGYDGSNGSPIDIAHYWIWKFANQLSDDYTAWEHIRHTGTILAGEGFSLKGVNDTAGNMSLEQNYTIEGKPNNGDITLPIDAGNDYLIGNPYASAIDAEQFILDNGPTIDGVGNTTGTLYFWEHWGGGSHALADYQGGYATYNLSGGTPSASLGTSDPDVSTGGTPTKIPGRYIPVAQGFFVSGENTGTIKFNNGQRIFQKEGTSASIFVRESEASASPTENADNGDDRMKIRLGFNSINTLHRQLLVTVDERATPNYDWGFDAKVIEDQMDDMYWLIEDEKYYIQGIDAINTSTIIPIGIHTRDTGINTFTIDALINFPDDLDIYLHDKELEIYHDLRVSNYQIELDAGDYLERFEITFIIQSLHVDDFAINNINVYFSNETNSMVINNPKNLQIDSAQIINMIGQSMFKYNNIEPNEVIKLETNNISSGTYIIKLETEIGEISKKVLAKL